MDKIVCLGKNYLDHAKELGDAVPEKPVLFLKPPSALVNAHHGVAHAALPPDGGNCHHECEIVIKIKTGGFRIPVAEAREQIELVTLGLDMTLRDLQAKLKKAGHPWEIAKAFPDSAIVGPWVLPRDFSHFESEPFSFELDGQVRQRACANDMIFKVDEAIAHASHYFRLCPGDLIFTGTPAGVGPVAKGSRAKLQWGPVHYEVQWQ